MLASFVALGSGRVGVEQVVVMENKPVNKAIPPEIYVQDSVGRKEAQPSDTLVVMMRRDQLEFYRKCYEIVMRLGLGDHLFRADFYGPLRFDPETKSLYDSTGKIVPDPVTDRIQKIRILRELYTGRKVSYSLEETSALLKLLEVIFAALPR
jgi:hypothetical protein